MNTKDLLRRVALPSILAMTMAIPVTVSAKSDKGTYRDSLNQADVNYRTALVRCDSLSAKSRQDCRNEAEETLERQRAATEKQREAGYEAAMEKCEPLHFNAQDVCEKDAAATYGDNN